MALSSLRSNSLGFFRHTVSLLGRSQNTVLKCMYDAGASSTARRTAPDSHSMYSDSMKLESRLTLFTDILESMLTITSIYFVSALIHPSTVTKTQSLKSIPSPATLHWEVPKTATVTLSMRRRPSLIRWPLESATILQREPGTSPIPTSSTPTARCLWHISWCLEKCRAYFQSKEVLYGIVLDSHDMHCTLRSIPTMSDIRQVVMSHSILGSHHKVILILKNVSVSIADVTFRTACMD